jgi:asparagine synthase (glutamine-hydrolysing)
MKMTDTDIGSLMTLRYQPGRSSPLTALPWTAFSPAQWHDPDRLVDEGIRVAIRELIEQHRPRRIGLALSGGIDSSLVAILVRDECPNVPIESISIHLRPDDPESLQADEVSGLIDSNHKHQTVSSVDLVKKLPELVAVVDEPRWNLYWYYVAENLVKRRCDLIVTGDGGDEVFGGYNFRYKLFTEEAEKMRTADKIRLYLEGHSRDWVPDQEKVFGPEVSFSWKKVYKALEPSFSNPLSPISQCFMADYNGKLLYDYAPTNEAIYQHFGITAATPLLHSGVSFIGNHLPIKEKFQLGYGKPILRRILSKYWVSEQIWRKPKLGFGVDPSYIVKSASRYLQKALTDPAVCEDGLINAAWLAKAWKRAEDSRVAHKILSIYALEMWYGRK